VITPRRPQDFQNINADKSSSALDHRQRFSIAAYYDLPYFKRGNWVTKNVLGNWLFAPVYTYQTGEPADVQSGIDANLNGDSAGDRAVFNPAGVGNRDWRDGTLQQQLAGGHVLCIVPCKHRRLHGK